MWYTHSIAYRIYRLRGVPQSANEHCAQKEDCNDDIHNVPNCAAKSHLDERLEQQRKAHIHDRDLLLLRTVCTKRQDSESNQACETNELVITIWHVGKTGEQKCCKQDLKNRCHCSYRKSGTLRLECRPIEF